MTTSRTETSSPISWRRAGWVAPFFGAAALVLVPWIVMLAMQLPAIHVVVHWDVTWVGFDVVLMALLVAVAAAAWRRSPWLEGTATAAATLLVVDAWFDVTTSSSRLQLGVSVGEALLVELPIAVFCLLLARNAERVLSRRQRLRPDGAAGSEAPGLAWDSQEPVGSSSRSS
jgi:hypothetical protein